MCVCVCVCVRTRAHARASVNGSHKLKNLWLVKFKKPRSSKNTIHIPVASDSQGNAQMTEELNKCTQHDNTK